MKRYLYLIALLLVFTSCNKFLDVQPQSQIDKNELFKTEEGFREALNGIYTSCASSSLYGGQLTFNFLDVMAQNYQFNDVQLQDIANFNYNNPQVKSMGVEVWSAGYHAITNCNYLLESIDKDKSIFSPGIYELIKGETLALRAYLHFDLCRMFAPSYLAGQAQKGIPYVTHTGITTTPFYPVGAVMDSVIRDLTAAKALLKQDPVIYSNYKVGYPSDEVSTELAFKDLLVQNRRHHLNYYAVCGELARVYLYKSDYANSLANAEEVIISNKFPFTKQEDFFETDLTKRDHVFYPELIAGWFIDTKDENAYLKGKFTNQAPQFSGTVDQVNDIYEIGNVGGDDWRLKQWFLTTASVTGGPDRAVLQKYYRTTDPLPNLHPQVAPAIRLSEMYYIAAEASFPTDPQKALDYFNIVRAQRGIGAAVDNVSADEFKELLLKEARKEFYGESQMFFMYKRLHHGVAVSATNTRPPSNGIFVFPIPDDELAYRNN